MSINNGLVKVLRNLGRKLRNAYLRNANLPTKHYTLNTQVLKENAQLKISQITSIVPENRAFNWKCLKCDNKISI